MGNSRRDRAGVRANAGIVRRCGLALCLTLLWLAAPAAAQDFSALARINPVSSIVKPWKQGAEVDLQ